MVRLLVNSRLLVKFLESLKFFVDFWIFGCVGVGVPSPCIVQESTTEVDDHHNAHAEANMVQKNWLPSQSVVATEALGYLIEGSCCMKGHTCQGLATLGAAAGPADLDRHKLL